MSEIIIPMQRLIVANANILIQRRLSDDDTIDIINHHVKNHESAGWDQIPAVLHRTGTTPVVIKDAGELYYTGNDHKRKHCCDKLKELLEWKERPFAVILVSNKKLFDFIGDRCYVFMRNVEEVESSKVSPSQPDATPIQEDIKPQPPTEQELLDCIQNLIGVFDNPISRRKITGGIADEARQQANNILKRTGRR